MERTSIEKRGKYILDLQQYSEINLAEELGELDLQCPLDNQYILRMLIREGFGELQVPPEINWTKPIIKLAEAHQQKISIKHYYMYITIRHGRIQSQTDDEWHVDGFSTSITHIPEQNYIWSNVYPTEILEKPIYFPHDFSAQKHNIHWFIQDTKNETDKISMCKPKTVYCIDPYIIHRRPPINTETIRTFVRVSFVPIEINDINNTQNPLLPKEYSRDGVLTFRNKLTRYHKY